MLQSTKILQVAHSHQDADPDLDPGFHLNIPHEDDWESGEYPIAEC